MMLLATSEGESLDSYVADDFGHAPFFLLVDSETLDYRVIVNEYKDSLSGAGVAVAEAIVSLGNVDAVLTGGIGMHGMDILSEAGIKVSTDEDGTVEDCIRDYLRRRERQAAFESRRRPSNGPAVAPDYLMELRKHPGLQPRVQDAGDEPVQPPGPSHRAEYHVGVGGMRLQESDGEVEIRIVGDYELELVLAG